MVNCHIHTFLLSDVPEKFLPAHLVKIMKNKIGYLLINKTLRDIIPFTSSDAIEKYANFLLIGESATQKDVFSDCQKFYPENTKFVVLSMDMAYMKAGKVTRTFKEQIVELGELSKENGVIAVKAHLRKKFVTINYDSTKVNKDKLITDLENLGFKTEFTKPGTIINKFCSEKVKE